MKIDLKDTTFVIIVRLDSVARLENTLGVVTALCRNFDTNVVVGEVDDRCNGVLRKTLPRQAKYIFFKDEDDILYRTKYLNRMVDTLETPVVSIWDVDIAVDKHAVAECVNKIRSGEADFAYPYNGLFMETSRILRKFYLDTLDIRILQRNLNKAGTPYYLSARNMVGGAFFANRQKYVETGGENERYYGWGSEDFDRYFKWEGLGCNIHRVDTPLFHLSHPRGDNSRFRSNLFQMVSTDELNINSFSLKQELEQKFCK